MKARAHTPTVAAIIPAYCDQATVADAVRSVLDQTYPVKDILVVDDGSPEDIQGALTALPRVRYVRRENGGPGAARNTGIEATNSDLLAFLDADDLWKPNKIAAQLEALEQHQEAVGSCCEAEVFRGDEVLWLFSRDRRLPELLDGALLLRGNAICNSTTLVWRDAIENAGGFDEDQDLISAEDYDLWLRLSDQGPFAWVSEPLARYRHAPGRLCKQDRYPKAVLKALESHEQRHTTPEVTGRIRKRRAELDRQGAYAALVMRNFRQAARSARRSLSLDPLAMTGWKMLLQAALRIPARDPRQSHKSS